MQRVSYISTLTAMLLALAVSNPSHSQTLQESDGFESTVAIVDTKVLFAIGAREAEQQLRGSFGWPTFQEGFVDGVYFRFDPDGYARFSSSARLDEDVFEVICTPGTVNCIATKGPLQIGLTANGPIQIRIDGITPQDSYFLTDRKTELPLPPGILGPLDARLETLLGSGGELLVKRELEVIQSLSLVGFNAVATYLRWVAQQQSPRVFPRGWPVPAQSETQALGGLTQPGQWDSPNAGPQQVSWGTAPIQQNQQQLQPQFNAQGPSVGFGVQQALNPLGTQQVNQQPSALQVAQMAELSQLRQTVLDLQNGLSNNQPTQQNLGVSQQAQAVINQDLGQSFAQQAQGRELSVDSVTFNGVASGGIVAQPVQAPIYVGGAPQQNLSSFSNQSIGQGQEFGQDRNAQNITAKLFELERDIHLLRSEIGAQLASIKGMIESLNHSQQTIGQNSQLGTVQNPQVSMVQSSETGNFVQRQQAPIRNGVLQPSAVGVVQPNLTGQNLSRVEELLLNRLANQNQNEASVTNQQTGSNINTLKPMLAGNTVDRQLVEEILNELGPAEMGAQAEDLSSGIANSNGQPNAETGGFVTLSDYINQIISKEGPSVEGAQ
jgi:hypothetical protein